MATQHSHPGLRANSPLAMRPDERQRFLAGIHVGIVAHDTSIAGSPLASPVWYSYEPGGDVVFVTSAGSLKARHLATVKRATFSCRTRSHHSDSSASAVRSA